MPERIVLAVDRTLEPPEWTKEMIEKLIPYFHGWKYTAWKRHIVASEELPAPWDKGFVRGIPWEGIIDPKQMYWFLAKYFTFRDASTDEDITDTVAHSMCIETWETLAKALPPYKQPRRRIRQYA